MSAPHPVRLSLGAYAVGSLEPADQRAVEAHLASCPQCLAELAELEPVVGALSLLTPDDMSAAPSPPSADLFARITSAVRADEVAQAREQRRRPSRGRPSRRVLVAAAAVVVLGGAGAAVGVVASSSRSHPSATVASAASGPVRLAVSASDLGARTRLVLTAHGLPAQEHCRLVARAADGSLHDAGEWDANYEGGATVVETTDVPRAQLRALTLYGTGGRHLVTIRL